MTSAVHIHTVWAFAGYLLLIVIIGLLAARFSSKDVSNYFIGGRSMRMFVVAMSAVVSGRSAWLLLGVTGMAYTMGLSAMWSVVGYTVAEFLLFYFYAPRIRKFSEEHSCITVPDFFADRFQDKGNVLRLVVVTIIILFMVSYISAQFVAGGKAFQSSFNLSDTQGLLLTALIILFYTMLGGFLAVSLTDTVQGIIMLIALVALPLISIWHSGGLSAFLNQLSTLDNGTFLQPFSIATSALVGFLAVGLGSPGNPHIIARYMSIRHTAKLKTAAYVGTAANIVLAAGAVLTGLAARLYFPSVSDIPGLDTERIYPAMAEIHLHPFMFGIVVASIFAAIMSTADSQLLVAASALVRDVYEKVMNRNNPIAQKKLVMLSRLTVVVLVLMALLLGLIAEQLIFWLVLFAWAGLGAALGPTSILALFWKRTTRTGVIAGMISGALCVIVWKSIPALSSLIYELVPAFFLSLIVTVVVSLISSEKN